MCTVSFVPAAGGGYLTSNRDEKFTRQPALPPAVVEVNGCRLLYPKDGDKGGTWIGLNGRGLAAVLLNGADRPHQPLPVYPESRGRIIPRLLSAPDPLQAWEELDLASFEPFTLLLYRQGQLNEARWDGQKGRMRTLDPSVPHLWSSATLYDAPAQAERTRWFKDWLAAQPGPDRESILSFHRTAGACDPHNGLVIERPGACRTVSITSIELTGNDGNMLYHDLSARRLYRSRLADHDGSAGASGDRWRRFRIRLLNWEYWPFHVVYAPVYLYWFWLCLKARSFFFFNAANPTIRNGGFLMESKKEIYDLLPPGSYPFTLLCRQGAYTEEEVLALPELHGLSYPFIAKPDIGLRGMSVQLLQGPADLAAYHRSSRVDYLLQAFVPYREEAGIFYYRLPGEAKGRITGVVGKGFLAVKGDGKRTVEELLQRSDRAFLQLPALRRSAPELLCEVPADGEERLLVPYGNHCRGTCFLDSTHLVTRELEVVVDALCRSVPGFYFGRLDIRYDNWDDLCQGRYFSVVELNGAGSEPAHVYDPKHSIWFAWKEIIRHLDLLYEVSRRNHRQGARYLSLAEGVAVFRANSAHVRQLEG